MALHTSLPIYKAAYTLFDLITDLARNMPRDFKHSIGGKHYIRYVDDFVLLHESAQWLNEAKSRIETMLADQLHARLNPRKTVLQPVARGIDFVGQVTNPWRRTLRRRTFNDAIKRVRTIGADDLFETANSYYGLLRQASHSHRDRAMLSNELRRRGHSIKSDLKKTYRRKRHEPA